MKDLEKLSSKEIFNEPKVSVKKAMVDIKHRIKLTEAKISGNINDIKALLSSLF